MFPPFLGENMTGWNTSNDMWGWIQLCSHTFWIWDCLKHSLFTSVPSESRQTPGWWVEKEETQTSTDLLHTRHGYTWTNTKTSRVQAQNLAGSMIPPYCLTTTLMTLLLHFKVNVGEIVWLQIVKWKMLIAGNKHITSCKGIRVKSWLCNHPI